MSPDAPQRDPHAARAIHDGLFTWPADEPRLIGSKCADCGTVTFPAQDSCPKCCGQSVARHLLARRGTLWSWTIQGFPPKAPPYAGPVTPDRFQPFGVGYVELAGEVIVETRLTENDPDKLAIGMTMELVIEPFDTDAPNGPVVTYAFRPVAGDDERERG